jgi:hypothetical protein
MAVVCIKAGTNNLKDLEALAEICQNFNKKWGKTKAYQGAYFAERIVLSKCILKDPEIQAKVGSNTNRVFWHRNADKNTQALLQDTKGFKLASPLEVVVTLNNWHFTWDKDFTKGHLDKVITPYLMTQCQARGVIGDLSFTWMPTQQMNTW